MNLKIIIKKIIFVYKQITKWIGVVLNVRLKNNKKVIFNVNVKIYLSQLLLM